MGPGETATLPFQSVQRSSEVQFQRWPVRLATGQWEIATGYRRCRSFDAGNDAGQDFAAVHFDDRYVVGVVADGVAQSFHGAIAAHEVTAALLAELWEDRERPPGDAEIAAVLQRRALEVGREIEAIKISPNLPEMVRLADEQTRSHGSQAVFSAFVLDTARRRLHVYKVGDAPAVVFTPGTPPEPIDSPRRGRWSSTGKTDLQLRVEVREGVEGCLIHSDGLESTWGVNGNLPDRKDFASLAEDRSLNDDVSFVWVQRRSGQLSTVGSPKPQVVPPPPAIIRRTPPILPPSAKSQESKDPGPAAPVAQPFEITHPLALPGERERDVDPPPAPRPSNRRIPAWVKYAAALAVGILLGWSVKRNPESLGGTPSNTVTPPPTPAPTPHPTPAPTSTPTPPTVKPLPPSLLQPVTSSGESGRSSIKVTLMEGADKVELKYAGNPYATLFRNRQADVTLRLIGIPKGKFLPLTVRVEPQGSSFVYQGEFPIYEKSYTLNLNFPDESH